MDDSGKHRGPELTLLPLRKRLDDAGREADIRLDVVQQDYVLSWLLEAMFNVDFKSTVLFKGGTALKKCYFGKYRFSEDLDFSVIDLSLTEEQIESSIIGSVQRAEEMMNQYAPMELNCRRYVEKDPHPHGQIAFVVGAKFPWQREALTKVMIEFTFGEKIVTPYIFRPILHNYGEDLGAEIPVYSLEEIVLEKHRAILQHTKKLHERDWGRSRARDYYDLWRIFDMYSSQLQFSDFSSQLSEKCVSKGVFFDGVESFFDQKMLGHVRKTWERWLGPLISSLPSYEQVILDLRGHLKGFLRN